MANFLTSLFNRSGDSVLGVDIGPSSIKIVELRKKKGRAVLVTYGALALGPYAGIEVGRATHLPPEKVGEALLDLLREASTSTKKSGFSIPMSSSLLTVIEVPAVDAKQLAQIVPIEARKYIPVPISEVALDWIIIPKEQAGISDFQAAEPLPGAQDSQFPSQNNSNNGNNQVGSPHAMEKMQVLLVVIHNDAIAQMQEIIKYANMDASFFEIEIFSTIRSTLDHEAEPVMIVDMGASSTKLYIIDRGILKTSHIITRGSQDLTLALSKALNINIEEAEIMKRDKGLMVGENKQEEKNILTATLDYVFAEINRVILNYQKKYRKNVGKAILTGGGAALKGFLELAQSNLQTDVELGDPFSKVEAPAFLNPVLKRVGPEFAVSIGIALRKLQDLG